MPELDRFVSADAPVVVPLPSTNGAPSSSTTTPASPKKPRRTDDDRARAKAALDARVRRWNEIEAAGGVDNWITSELAKKGFVDEKPADIEDTGDLARAVDELELSVRTANALQEAGIATIGQLTRTTEAEVLQWKHMNRLGLKELKDILAEMGLAFGAHAKTTTSSTDGASKAALKERKKAEASERRALRKLAWSAYTATHINHVGDVHWNDHVDVDRFDIAEREQRTESLGLPALPDPNALADALGVAIPTLRWLCTHKDVDEGTHYRRFTIPKRDGSPRTIAEPMPLLKQTQRFILENIVDKLEVHGAAHGFLADRSIVSNARVHAGADVLVKIDVKDFFPTLSFARVKGLLRKAGLVEQVATLCALLATEAPRDVVKFRGKTLYVATGPRALPQGAPSSPAITNAICLRLDKRMSGLAKKLGFAYTRYADDLAFSWRGKKSSAPIGQLLGGARTILESEGFALHDKKTAVLTKGMRQKITGLVVNEAPGKAPARVPRETRRQLRAALHNRKNGKPGKPNETLAQLEGMAAFVYMTDPVQGRRFLDEVRALER